MQCDCKNNAICVRNVTDWIVRFAYSRQSYGNAGDLILFGEY